MTAVLGNILLVLLFVGIAIFLATWAWAIMTDPRRVNPDLCDECGYDMRVTPDRCPECGWVRVRHNLIAGRIDVGKLLETAPEHDVRLREPGADETQVVAYETDFREDAEILKEHLEARGAICDIVEHTSVMPHGSRFDGRYYFQVVVWSGDAVRAAALVAKARVSTPEDDIARRAKVSFQDRPT